MYYREEFASALLLLSKACNAHRPYLPVAYSCASMLCGAEKISSSVRVCMPVHDNLQKDFSVVLDIADDAACDLRGSEWTMGTEMGWALYAHFSRKSDVRGMPL